MVAAPGDDPAGPSDASKPPACHLDSGLDHREDESFHAIAEVLKIPHLDAVQPLVGHPFGLVALEHRAELVPDRREQRFVVPERVVGVERHEFDHLLTLPDVQTGAVRGSGVSGVREFGTPGEDGLPGEPRSRDPANRDVISPYARRAWYLASRTLIARGRIGGPSCTCCWPRRQCPRPPRARPALRPRVKPARTRPAITSARATASSRRSRKLHAIPSTRPCSSMPGLNRPQAKGQALIWFNARHDGITLQAVGDVVLTAANPQIADSGAPSHPAVVNHVVYFGDGISPKTVLRGFTITGANNYTTGSGEHSPLSRTSPQDAVLLFRRRRHQDLRAVVSHHRARRDLRQLHQPLRRRRVGRAPRTGAASRSLFRNCIFRNNRTQTTGAAVDLLHGSRATLDNCLFVGNIANMGVDYVGLLTGGEYHPSTVRARSPSSKRIAATVSRCTFTGNWNGVDDGDREHLRRLDLLAAQPAGRHLARQPLRDRHRRRRRRETLLRPRRRQRSARDGRPRCEHARRARPALRRAVRAGRAGLCESGLSTGVARGLKRERYQLPTSNSHF